MKIFCFIILSISLISCDSNNKTSHQLEQKTDFSNQILKSEIQNSFPSDFRKVFTALAMFFPTPFTI